MAAPTKVLFEDGNIVIADVEYAVPAAATTVETLCRFLEETVFVGQRVVPLNAKGRQIGTGTNPASTIDAVRLEPKAGSIAPVGQAPSQSMAPLPQIAPSTASMMPAAAPTSSMQPVQSSVAPLQQIAPPTKSMQPTQPGASMQPYQTAGSAPPSMQAMSVAAGSASRDADVSLLEGKIPRAEIVLGKELARGAFGAVYSATRNGGRVAVKKLLKNMTAGERADFEREVKLMRALRHPHIVQFMGLSVDTDGADLLVSELMEGGTLKSWLYPATVEQQNASKALTNERLLLLAWHISQALSYLHFGTNTAVVHRDLKPDNILVNVDCTVAKLADFGLASLKQTSSDRNVRIAGGACGTPVYMAPEVLRGEPYGPAADIYSFGIILCEFWARESPFAKEAKGAGSAQEVVQVLQAKVGQKGKRPDLPKGLPETPDIGALIRAAWAQDPAKRPTARALVDTLEVKRRPSSCSHKHEQRFLAAMKLYDAGNGPACAKELQEIGAGPDGHPDALGVLAFFYCYGEAGVDRDPKKAFATANTAVATEAFSAFGCYRLGMMYNPGESQSIGIGCTKNVDEADKWFSKAATRSVEMCRFSVGKSAWGGMLLYGRGVGKNTTKALEVLREAATYGAGGWPHVALGDALKRGHGLPKDPAEAVTYFRKGAQLGCQLAQINLAGCYREGTGTPKNYAEAFKWYSAAAKQGDHWGYNGLGLCYEYGLGVGKDTKKAKQYYKMACEQGNDYAAENIKRV